MKLNQLKKYGLLLFCIGVSQTVFSQSDLPSELSPPPFNPVDKFQVSMATGTVYATLEDISIGGDLGLTHSISSNGGNFVYYDRRSRDYWGFMDKFKGGMYGTVHSYTNPGSNNPADRVEVLRVFGDGESSDFRVVGDGYVSIQDERFRLNYVGDHYEMITPEGKKLVFNNSPHLGNGLGATQPVLQQIVYPNNFTINIDTQAIGSAAIGGRIERVWTNTGYELRYVYEDDNRPAITASHPLNTREPSAPLDWSRRVPKCIVALNTSVDSLPNNFSCDLPGNFPIAKYQWPQGMPRAAFNGNTVFRVTDAVGRITEFHHAEIRVEAIPDSTSANDIATSPNFQLFNNNASSINFYSRIDKIKTWNSDHTNIEYDYGVKTCALTGFGLSHYACGGPVLSSAQRIIGANNNGQITGDSSSYSMNEPDGPGGFFLDNAGNAYKGVHLFRRDNKNLRVEVRTWDKNYHFDQFYFVLADNPEQKIQINNRINRIEHKFGGGQTEYYYTETGNIERVVEEGVINAGTGNAHNILVDGVRISSAQQITIAAYDEVCDETGSNNATCNKATRVTNPRGHTTYYTYHPSGQVATITPPTNESGVSPVKHYQYFDNNEYPVVLLKSETSCLDSQYSVDTGTCADGDVITKEYEYETANMNLIGISITANSKTLTTCYEFDKFGNKIGEVKPKGNIGASSCIAETGV